MLDERCLHLLNVINAECTDCGYKVFEIEDLAASFPACYSMDGDGVRACIKALNEREYISVKYEDDKEICALALSKGRYLAEKTIDEEVLRGKERLKYCAYAFFGAIIGGVIASALSLIVFFLVK